MRRKKFNNQSRENLFFPMLEYVLVAGDRGCWGVEGYGNSATLWSCGHFPEQAQAGC